ncbi:hypothetical protein ACFOWB_15880 [Chenggangzhangella methanolivorans]|uniref:hypothetical protein n=1 Tax=Chenggangzhangella methanolivorans TaxID=1437009 RepID=UPI00361C7507
MDPRSPRRGPPNASVNLRLEIDAYDLPSSPRSGRSLTTYYLTMTRNGVWETDAYATSFPTYIYGDATLPPSTAPFTWPQPASNRSATFSVNAGDQVLLGVAFNESRLWTNAKHYVSYSYDCF